MRRSSSFAPARRRRSPVGLILLIVALLLVGFLVYLSTRDSEVPTQRIEEDVTNAVLAG